MLGSLTIIPTIARQRYYSDRLLENDDESASSRNSKLEAEMQPGTYTIEATTYNSMTTGEFTLTLEIGEPEIQPQPTPPAVTPTPPARTPTPGPPTTTPDSGFVDVSRGADHACALHSNGSITCWGANGEGQATPPDTGRFIVISSSDNGTCAVRDDGEVLCWGSFVVETGSE